MAQRKQGEEYRKLKCVIGFFYKEVIGNNREQRHQREGHSLSKSSPNKEIIDMVRTEGKDDCTKQTKELVARECMHGNQCGISTKPYNRKYINLIYNQQRNIQRIQDRSWIQKQIAVEQGTGIAEPVVLIRIDRNRKLQIASRRQQTIDTAQMKGKIQTGKEFTVIKRYAEDSRNQKRYN